MYILNCRGTNIEISSNIKDASSLFKTYFDKLNIRPLLLDININDIHRAIDYILGFDNKVDDRFINILKYLGIEIKALSNDEKMSVLLRFLNSYNKNQSLIMNALDNLASSSKDIKDFHSLLKSSNEKYFFDNKPKEDRTYYILNNIVKDMN